MKIVQKWQIMIYLKYISVKFKTTFINMGSMYKTPKFLFDNLFETLYINDGASYI